MSSLCTGQVVYASLAQMSVKGAANSKLESLSVGMLDVFSSAFWTHPSYAHSVIRNCDEELTFSAKAAGVKLFQPPRSMDVVYNMFAVVDLPGLVNTADIGGVDYEVITNPADQPVYRTTVSLETTGNLAGYEIVSSTHTATKDLIAGLNNAGTATALRCTATMNGAEKTFYLASVASVAVILDADAADETAGKTVFRNSFDTDDQGNAIPTAIEFTLTGIGGDSNYEIDLSGTGNQEIIKIWGCGFVHSDFTCHYVDAIGQFLIRDVEMTIGGARVGLLNSMYMYIHEELFGHPGRRQEEMIGKLGGGIYEPEHDDGVSANAGTRALIKKSMVARRLYIQLPFWWTGGKMERALKTIALQLHKIEFKVQTRKLEDCIAYSGSNLSGANLPSASTQVNPCVGYNSCDEDAVTATITTSVRHNEHIDPSNNLHLIGEVRRNANGKDVFLNQRGVRSSKSSAVSEIRAYLQIDFCGIFLNQTTRDVYLKLDEKTLFSQVLGTDTDGIALDQGATGQRTETLNFSNAVYDVMVALHSVDAAQQTGDAFGLRGTSRDATTKLRDDALRTLSFDISSTPRTITHLASDYYRHITQFQAAKTMSTLKGLYYYNVQLFDELNGTRCVNSYINASKIDDLRMRFQVNNGSYGGKQLLKATNNGNCKIYAYAHIYNTLQIRNGMAGAMFA